MGFSLIDSPSEPRPTEVCGGAAGKESYIEAVAGTLVYWWRGENAAGRMVYHRWFLAVINGRVGWVCTCGKLPQNRPG